MASAKSDTSEGHKSIWDLPLEIRNKIYYEYFDFENGEARPRVKDRSSTKPISGLLRTCQAIYSEATIVLYSQHTFYFTDAEDQRKGNSTLASMGRWLAVVGQSNGRWIRHLHFHFGGLNGLDFSRLSRHTPSKKKACCPIHGPQAGLAQLQSYWALQTMMITFELSFKEVKGRDILLGGLNAYCERERRCRVARCVFTSLFSPDGWMREMLCGIHGL